MFSMVSCYKVSRYQGTLFDKFQCFTPTEWPKEEVQKDKQRSTKHTRKTKDRVTRTPLKTGVNSGAPEG